MAIPSVGSEVEVYGSLGFFLAADVDGNGGGVVTVRMPEGNVRLVKARAEAAGSAVLQLSPTIIQVPVQACIAKHHGCGLAPEGYLQAGMSDSLVKLQRILARRMRFSA